MVENATTATGKATLASLSAKTDLYLSDVLLLCTECQRPIKARINTQQWIRVEWIGPNGECQVCYQEKRNEPRDGKS